MTSLKILCAATVLALAQPVYAQHVHATPDVPEIASAQPSKGGCEKCKKGGSGMQHDGMAGKADMQHGKGCCCNGGGDAALAQRIAELEKRLDLMQFMLTRSNTP